MNVAEYAFREARPGDEAVISRFVRALAVVERLESEVVATQAQYRSALFAEHPRVFALIVEAASAPIGFALWFYNYSTFNGLPGLYVEDAYVDAGWRGRGVGTALFRHLAQLAVAEGCGRMEWWVLDENTPAVAFYRRIGARAMNEWTVQRLAGATLTAVACGKGNG